MFIRWQKRTRSIYRPVFGSGSDDINWTAVLLKAVRIDGKSWQRYIGCIASIHQSALDLPNAHQRCWFWDKAMERLHRLSNEVDEEDRGRIIATIAEKVPMSSREEYEGCHRSVRERLGEDDPLPEHPLHELPADFLDTLDHSQRIVIPRRQA
jgi:hypothetical protein